MLKRIVITGIVSSMLASALNAWLRRIAAQKRDQEIDVQRWEDEGGQAAAAHVADGTEVAHGSELRA